MNKRAAFTKADLVVGVVCVGFLFANIAAVGPGGQRHAKEMLCLSKLQKWGEFSRSYLNDNGGYFMKGYVYDAPSASDMWMRALRPYYKKHQMRVCPQATVPGSEIGLGPYGGGGTFVAWGIFEGGGWEPISPGDYGSYGINGWAYNSQSDSPWGRPNYYSWRVANVAGAENIPLFLDSMWIEGWPDDMDEPPAYEGEPWSYYDQIVRFCINRHRGYVGSGFLDGSARKVGLKELWTLKWHREFDTCGVWTVCGGVQPGDWPIWMQEFEDY